MEEIIIQIKQELKNKKITYQKFADMLEIPHGTIRNILNDTNDNPGIKTVISMLKALQMDKFEKTPSGTVLTKTEQTIMDIVVNSTEQQQLLILAYASGLHDTRNIGNMVIDYNEDKWSKNKKL